MNALPLALALFCVLAGMIRRAPVYDAFLTGALEGLDTARRIVPSLVGMLCAIAALRACGVLDAICRVCAPALTAAGLPPGVLPLMLLRPLSGSASLAMLSDIMAQYGPDSREGLTACALMGSSETIFYTCTLYLSAAGVKRSRHAIPAALLAWLAGSLVAGWMCAGA